MAAETERQKVVREFQTGRGVQKDHWAGEYEKTVSLEVKIEKSLKSEDDGVESMEVDDVKMSVKNDNAATKEKYQARELSSASRHQQTYRSLVPSSMYHPYQREKQSFNAAARYQQQTQQRQQKNHLELHHLKQNQPENKSGDTRKRSDHISAVSPHVTGSAFEFLNYHPTSSTTQTTTTPTVKPPPMDDSTPPFQDGHPHQDIENHQKQREELQQRSQAILKQLQERFQFLFYNQSSSSTSSSSSLSWPSSDSSAFQVSVNSHSSSHNNNYTSNHHPQPQHHSDSKLRFQNLQIPLRTNTNSASLNNVGTGVGFGGFYSLKRVSLNFSAGDAKTPTEIVQKLNAKREERENLKKRLAVM
jgi:hypothetical protein